MMVRGSPPPVSVSNWRCARRMLNHSWSPHTWRPRRIRLIFYLISRKRSQKVKESLKVYISKPVAECVVHLGDGWKSQNLWMWNLNADPAHLNYTPSAHDLLWVAWQWNWTGNLFKLIGGNGWTVLLYIFQPVDPRTDAPFVVHFLVFCPFCECESLWLRDALFCSAFNLSTKYGIF